MVKKKWSKPECEKVRLVAEEAVLTGCKMATGGAGPGNFKGACNSAGFKPCSTQTS